MTDPRRMGLREMGINTRNWVDSAQDRDYWRALVNAAVSLSTLMDNLYSMDRFTDTQQFGTDILYFFQYSHQV